MTRFSIGDRATFTASAGRIKQLLKSGGVAVIILPSSILSNGCTTYIRAREILLQYFDIVAIVENGAIAPRRLVGSTDLSGAAQRRNVEIARG